MFTKYLIAAALIAATAAPAFAGKCDNKAFNPVTDVTWSGLFPIRVGGVKLTGDSGVADSAEGSGLKSPICKCYPEGSVLPYFGLNLAFWDINNLVEIVETPGCSTTLGKSLAMNDRGFHGGTVKSDVAAPVLFKQAHWVKFPMLSILGMLTDFKCAGKGGGFDIATLSEYDPAHNNDLIAAFRRPDNLIFANPAFDLVQPANVLLAHTTAGTLPGAYDSLFWMYWDNIYPLSGSKASPHDLEGSAQIAAKQIYSFYGMGILWDNVSDYCEAKMTWTPKKSHWRYQLAKPVKTPKPFIAGMSEFVWGMGGKNPPFKEGNFLFVLFQKKNCCERILGGAQ